MKKINQLKSFVVIFLSIVFFLGGCKSPYSEIVNPAQKGVMNLAHWDTSLSPVVPLDGDWGFQILGPDGFSETATIKVPGIWNFLMKSQGYGVGKYILTIALPDKEFISQHQLAIQMNDISTAYELRVNGDMVFKKGKVGYSKEEMQPSYKRDIILLPTNLNSSELNLEVTVSNFYHPKGGIRSSIFLGKWNQLVLSEKNQLSVMWVLIGATMVMSIYHFVIYSLRVKDRSILWFSLLAFQVGCRAIFDKSVFVYRLLPDEYWVYIHKIDVITFALTLPFFSLFLASLFPKDFHKKMLNLFVIVGLVFGISILSFPSTIYMQILNYFEIFILFSIIYFLYIIFVTLKNKREGAYLFLFGCLILFATTIHDILNQMRIIYTGFYTNWGFLAFLFSQTTLLARRFTQAYNSMEDSKEILESKVLERTQELSIAKKKAEDANQIKDKFLSLVSHDLRSPIATVIGTLNLLIEDYKEMSDEENLDFLEKAKTNSEYSLELLSQLLSLNRLRSGDFEIKLSNFDMYLEVETVFQRVFIQSGQKSLSLINQVPMSFQIYSDKILVNTILFNLLSNAIKFSKPKSEIIVSSKEKEDNYQFSVKDYGIGISQDIIQNIFRSDIKTTTSGTMGEVGTGLGLPFVKDILDKLGGEIFVEMSGKMGTTFTFQLPKE